MNTILRLLTEDKSEISILKTKANNQATRLESLKNSMTSKINEIKDNLGNFPTFQIRQLIGK